MKKTVIRYTMLVLTILIAVLIFMFSAQTGEKSGDSSGRLTYKILKIFVPSLDINDPADAAELEKAIHYLRKCAHFTEFFALGASLFGFFATYERTALWRLSFAYGIGTVYAVTDEIHQIFVPDRGPSVFDVMLDSAGVLCGVLVVFACIMIVKKRREKGCHRGYRGEPLS